MDVESRTLLEAATIGPEHLERFYQEIEKIPSYQSPISGHAARLAFEFMEDTALRGNETIHVRKQDIDFRTRVLTVIEPKVSIHCKCSIWKNANQYTTRKVLEFADPGCVLCHGIGRYKKAQKTTITPRYKDELQAYAETLKNDDAILFDVSRVTLWTWAKKAGINAGLDIFTQKEDQAIDGMFVHLFRSLATLRMQRDAKDEEYRDQLIMCKRRDSFKKTVDRYRRVDLNYLLAWESKRYG